MLGTLSSSAAGAAASLLVLCACSAPPAEEAPETSAGGSGVAAVGERTEEPAPSAPPAPVDAPEVVAGEPSPGPAAAATVGGDGSPILLSGLNAEEIDRAALAGELGCTFSTGPASVLLVAKGDVASKELAGGVVKVGDSVERVVNQTAGGFDAMLKGATFVGQGKMIRITLTGEAPVGGGESPPNPATLTYDRADGARRTIQGLWTCGP